MGEGAARAARRWLDRQGPELPLRLTLLLVLLAQPGTGPVGALLLLLAAAALLHEGLLRSPGTWLALASLAAWRAIAAWPLADNHAYLLAYWCLGIGLSRILADPARGLATSARLLVGATFLFATTWKLLSFDYLDGTFFRVWLLTDLRFEELARWVGGLDAADLEASRHFLYPPPAVGAEHLPRLVEPPALRRLAAFLTWATLALEALTAVLFLLPARWRASGLRHAALLAFCATTYAIAPVASFGWLLLAMGVATSGAAARGLRGAYLACFGLLVVYDHVPWSALLPSALLPG